MDLLDNDLANTDALASLCRDFADDFPLALPVDAPASAAPSTSPSSPQSTTSGTDVSSIPLGDLPLPLLDPVQLDGADDYLFPLTLALPTGPLAPPRITCADCGRPFNARQDLLRHQKLMHEATPVGFACEECGKAFKLHYDLKRHLSSHQDERPFACHCGKSFKLKTQLQRHQLVHSEERAHQCDQCDKSFKQRAALTRHMATHTDVRPFGCECGMAFRQHAHLRSHQDRGTCGRTPLPV